MTDRSLKVKHTGITFTYPTVKNKKVVIPTYIDKSKPKSIHSSIKRISMQWNTQVLKNYIFV